MGSRYFDRLKRSKSCFWTAESRLSFRFSSPLGLVNGKAVGDEVVHADGDPGQLGQKLLHVAPGRPAGIGEWVIQALLGIVRVVEAQPPGAEVYRFAAHFSDENPW